MASPRPNPSSMALLRPCPSVVMSEPPSPMRGDELMQATTAQRPYVNPGYLREPRRHSNASRAEPKSATHGKREGLTGQQISERHALRTGAAVRPVRTEFSSSRRISC
jgi:hypothetical protein